MKIKIEIEIDTDKDEDIIEQIIEALENLR